MNLLLDTHIFLWYIEGSSKLSDRSKDIIQDPTSSKFVSIASLWEIAIKTSRDKLVLTQPFDRLNAYIDVNGFKLLNIKFDHLSKLKDLPYHHADPFDRVIISQALSENLSLISVDRHFKSYPLNVIW